MLDAPERFSAMIEQTPTCWIWTGPVVVQGYGRFTSEPGVRILAHRYAYELWVAPIPQGLQIDHICHQKLCVNPTHLRAVTIQQNIENRQGANRNNGTSGIRGVSLVNGRWQVTVMHNRRSIYCGRYDTLSEAEAAAIEARNSLHTHNDRDRKAK